MKLLPGFAVFDTETSGLYDFKKPADDPAQARLAAIGIITVDADFNILSETKLYVRPEGWIMEPGATEVNGLTDEFLAENGQPVDEVLDIYEALIDGGWPIAAFNAQFDCKVMRGEFRRLNRADLFERTFNTCLMRASMKLGPYGFKSATRGWPKLAEVAEFFGHVSDDPHDPLADAHAALHVLRGLHSIDMVIPPAVHYAKKPAA